MNIPIQNQVKIFDNPISLNLFIALRLTLGKEETENHL
jgi:hypothetical protein